MTERVGDIAGETGPSAGRPVSESGRASVSAGSVAARARDYLRSEWPWALLALGIVVVAAALRFWELGRQGLWFDEIFSVNTTMDGPIAAVRLTAQDTNPPLYYVLQSLVAPIFGYAEWGMRVLPATFGVLTTAVVYLAGRKMFGRPVGAWAAAMFAVSDLALWYAQEARMYSQLMFFSALLLWSFVSLVEKPTRLRAVLMGLVLACLAYTHVYGYMIAPLLLAIVVVLPGLRRRVGKHTALACLLAALVFLPWVFAIPAQIEFVRSKAAIGGWWMQPPDGITSTLSYNLESFSPGRFRFAGVVFVALMIVGLAVRPRDAERSEGVSEEVSSREWELSVATFGLAVLPILAGLIISAYVVPVHNPRNGLVSLPAAYLIAAYGGSKLRKPLGTIAMALLLVFAVSHLPEFYSDTSKGDWRRASELVVAAQPGTAVIAQDYTAPITLETYARIAGLDPDFSAIWASGIDAPGGARGTVHGESTGTSLDEYLESRDAVYVVSMTKKSSAARYMEGLEGWRLTRTEELKKPVLRLYTRVDR